MFAQAGIEGGHCLPLEGKAVTDEVVNARTFPSPSGVEQSGGLFEMGQGCPAQAGQEREKAAAYHRLF